MMGAEALRKSIYRMIRAVEINSVASRGSREAEEISAAI